MKKIFTVLAVILSAFVSGAEIKVVLFPRHEAVISARVDSVLKPYPFKVGELFKSGSVVCRLENARYLLDVQKHTSHREFALAAYEDKKQLRAKNFTSDYELRKAAYDLQIAAHSLSEAKLNLSYCSIKAPFSGKIVEIMTRAHETCRPGQPLVRIIDDSQLLAVTNVPLRNGKLTKTGGTVSLKIQNGKIVKGRIHEVYPQADHRTGTVKIRILIPNSQRIFSAGMTGVLQDGQ